jgi:hypothetical protein
MVMAVMHAASGELSAGRISEGDAEVAVIETVAGAIANTP